MDCVVAWHTGGVKQSRHSNRDSRRKENVLMDLDHKGFHASQTPSNGLQKRMKMFKRVMLMRTFPRRARVGVKVSHVNSEFRDATPLYGFVGVRQEYRKPVLRIAGLQTSRATERREAGTAGQESKEELRQA